MGNSQHSTPKVKPKTKPQLHKEPASRGLTLMPEKPAFEHSKSQHSKKSAFQHAKSQPSDMGKNQHSTPKAKLKTKPQLRVKSQHPKVQPLHQKSLHSN